MARQRSEYDDERDYYAREERMRREAPSHSDSSYRDRQSFENERRPDYYNRGRYGERAEYGTTNPATARDENAFPATSGVAPSSTFEET